ncbi:MAG: DUF5906 domain-containing protein [Anaerolineaceae bacterium]
MGDLSNLINVDTQTPCPICGHSDWCSYSADGFRVICRRIETGSIRTASDASGAQYYIHFTEVGKNHYQSRIEQERAAAETIPQASPEFTHEFYTGLLHRLSLTAQHRAALRTRGLTDEEIDRLGYRSWPDDPPWKFAKTLKEKYGEKACQSIPGFYYAENKAKTKRYLTLNYRAGIVIPSLNLDGMVQALITRADKSDGAKYVILSSKKRGGFTPSMECHIPTVESSQRLTGTVSTVRVTEGVLKADIATMRSGILTLGLQGLTWKRSLPTLQRLAPAPARILIAFDADASKNLHVAQSLKRFVEALRQDLPAASVGLEIWPIDWGKGIDDCLAAGYKPSILEVREHVDREIERIIQSAKEHRTRDPLDTEPQIVIEELNKKHAILPIGSNVTILWEHENPETKRIDIDFLRKNDFITLYENRTVLVNDENGKPKAKPATRHWLSSLDRREYEQLVFSPGQDNPKYYNLWRGFAVEPQPGDWSLYRQHILENICGGDNSLFKYILAWMADAVQNLTNRPGVALVLRGKQGTGKGVFCREFGALFGQHFTHISQSKHLTGSFNAHLKDCLLLFADEAFWAGDKQGEGSLKALITEPEFLIELKGHDAIRMTNRVRLIIASNNEWVIPAGIEERRFCVIDMADSHMQDHAYFAAITKQMNDGGRAALLYDLLRHDLSSINLRSIPQTSALFDQKIQTIHPAEQFWYQILLQGKFFPEDGDWRDQIEKDKLYDLYLKVIGQAGVNRKGMEIQLGKYLRKICPGIEDKKLCVPLFDETNHVTGTARKMFWILPDLNQCRSDFANIMIATIQWPVDDGDSETDNEEGSKDGYLPF